MLTNCMPVGTITDTGSVVVAPGVVRLRSVPSGDAMREAIAVRLSTMGDNLTGEEAARIARSVIVPPAISGKI